MDSELSNLYDSWDKLPQIAKSEVFNSLYYPSNDNDAYLAGFLTALNKLQLVPDNCVTYWVTVKASSKLRSELFHLYVTAGYRRQQ